MMIFSVLGWITSKTKIVTNLKRFCFDPKLAVTSFCGFILSGSFNQFIIKQNKKYANLREETVDIIRA